MNDLRTIIEAPQAVVLPPLGTCPEWQGMALGSILEAHPGEGLRLLELLVDGHDGGFGLKLASALLLAQKHGWGPFAGNGKAAKATSPKAKAKKGIPDALTGAVLNSAVVALRKVVYAKAKLPVLRCIMLRQTAEALVLSTTNLETYLRLTLPFGGEPWEAVVEAKALYDAVRATGTGKTHQVDLACDDTGLHLSGPRGKTTLPVTIPPDDFPLFPTETEGHQVIGTIRGLDLKLMTTVATAAATGHERPVLTGVYLDLAEGEIAAADGFRLAFAPVEVEAEFSETGAEENAGDESKGMSLLVPATAVQIAGQTMTGIEEMSVVENRSVTTAALTGPARPGGRMELGTVLIDGHFPDYPEIAPPSEAVPVVFQVNTVQVLEAAKGLVPVAKQVANILVLEVDGGILRMTVAGSDIGSHVAEVPVTAQQGRTRWVANAKYVANALETLKQIGAETATFRVGRVTFDGQKYRSPYIPFIVEGEALTWMIMPMHLTVSRGKIEPWEDEEAKQKYAQQVAEASREAAGKTEV